MENDVIHGLENAIHQLRGRRGPDNDPFMFVRIIGKIWLAIQEIKRLRVIEKAVAEMSPTAGDLYGGTYCVFCDEYDIYSEKHGPNCGYRLATEGR